MFVASCKLAFTSNPNLNKISPKIFLILLFLFNKVEISDFGMLQLLKVIKLLEHFIKSFANFQVPELPKWFTMTVECIFLCSSIIHHSKSYFCSNMSAPSSFGILVRYVLYYGHLDVGQWRKWFPYTIIFIHTTFGYFRKYLGRFWNNM